MNLLCKLSGTAVLGASLLLTSTSVGNTAEWENLNPGAGGRIQDIVLDPNTPNRAFYCSDMEGLYRSDDAGGSWQYLGEDLSHSCVLTAAVEPGNSDRVYAGTLQGVEVSDNAGDNWKRHPDVNDPIHRIGMDPRQPQRVFALPGNHMRWTKKQGVNQDRSSVGERLFYLSEDGGKTFQSITFDAEEGRRDVWDVAFDPSDKNKVYLAAISGVYVSEDGGKSWMQMESPAATGDCWGLSISPDGEAVYATFQVASKGQGIQRWTESHDAQRIDNALFVMPTKQPGKWFDLSEGMPKTPDRLPMGLWHPETDPRSTSHEHQVLTAPWTSRAGLYQVSVPWKNGKPGKPKWERILYYNNNGVGAEFDFGWEKYSTRPLAWAHTPESWGQPYIYTTGDQTLFKAKAKAKNLDQAWESIYTDFVRELDGKRFYRTRGAQCTFVFDAGALGNYVAQSNADNAVKESYDHGHSWTIGIHKPRSNSITILEDLNPPMVLTHISGGFGADSDRGELWAKHLEKKSPKDEWKKVGGGDSRIGNLPNKLYEQIVQDPHQPKRVFIGTKGAGTYVIDDIEAFVKSEGKKSRAYKMKGGPRVINDKGKGMVADPNEKGVLWAAAENTLYKVTETKPGEWEWEPVRQSEKRTQMDVWDHEGVTQIAMIMDPGDAPATVDFSTDGGKSWKQIYAFDDVKDLRRPAWYRENENRFYVRGLVGHGDKIYLAPTTWETSKSYGMFEGTIAPNGTVKWKDITKNFGFPFPVKSRIVTEGQDRWLYVATKGWGLWRIKLSDNAMVSH